MDAGAMMGRHTLPLLLSPDEKKMLEHAFNRHADWRVRERAQTLILLGQGWSCDAVAEHLGLCAATVRSTRQAWWTERFAGLVDKPRCGAPHKLSGSDVQRLMQWADAEPLTAEALLTRHVETQGRKVHLNTLMSELKRQGFVWKRTRHSLKKSPPLKPSSRPSAT
jgi:transposase